MYQNLSLRYQRSNTAYHVCHKSVAPNVVRVAKENTLTNLAGYIHEDSEHAKVRGIIGWFYVLTEIDYG